MSDVFDYIKSDIEQACAKKRAMVSDDPSFSQARFAAEQQIMGMLDVLTIVEKYAKLERERR